MPDKKPYIEDLYNFYTKKGLIKGDIDSFKDIMDDENSRAQFEDTVLRSKKVSEERLKRLHNDYDTDKKNITSGVYDEPSSTEEDGITLTTKRVERTDKTPKGEVPTEPIVKVAPEFDPFNPTGKESQVTTDGGRPRTGEVKNVAASEVGELPTGPVDKDGPLNKEAISRGLGSANFKGEQKAAEWSKTIAKESQEQQFSVAQSLAAQQAKDKQIVKEAAVESPVIVTGNIVLDSYLEAYDKGYTGDLLKFSLSIGANLHYTPQELARFAEASIGHINNKYGVNSRGGITADVYNPLAPLVKPSGIKNETLDTDRLDSKVLEESKTKIETKDRIDKAEREIYKLGNFLLNNGWDIDRATNFIIGKDFIQGKQDEIAFLTKKEQEYAEEVSAFRKEIGGKNKNIPNYTVPGAKDYVEEAGSIIAKQEAGRLKGENLSKYKQLELTELRNKVKQKILTSGSAQADIDVGKVAFSKGVSNEYGIVKGGIPIDPTETEEFKGLSQATLKLNTAISKLGGDIKAAKGQLEGILGEYKETPKLINFLNKSSLFDNINSLTDENNTYVENIKALQTQREVLNFQMKEKVLKGAGYHIPEGAESIPKNAYDYMVSTNEYAKIEGIRIKIDGLSKEIERVSSQIESNNTKLLSEIEENGWASIYNTDYVNIYRSLLEKPEAKELLGIIDDTEKSLPEYREYLENHKKWEKYLSSNPKTKEYLDALGKLEESGIGDTAEYKKYMQYNKEFTRLEKDIKSLPTKFVIPYYTRALESLAQSNHDEYTKKSKVYDIGMRGYNLMASFTEAVANSLSFPVALGATLNIPAAKYALAKSAPFDFNTYTSASERPISQRIVKIDGYDVALNNDNTIQGIYYEDGYKVFDPIKAAVIGESFNKSGLTVNDARIKYNRDSILSTGAQTTSEFVVLLANAAAINKVTSLLQISKTHKFAKNVLEAAATFPTYNLTIMKGLLEQGVPLQDVALLGNLLTLSEAIIEQSSPLATNTLDNAIYKTALVNYLKKPAIMSLFSKANFTDYGFTFITNALAAIIPELGEEALSYNFATPVITSAFQNLNKSTPLIAENPTVQGNIDTVLGTLSGTWVMGVMSGVSSLRNMPYNGMKYMADPANLKIIENTIRELTNIGGITTENSDIILGNIGKLHTAFSEIENLGDKSMESEKLRNYILYNEFKLVTKDYATSSNTERSNYIISQQKIQKAKDLLRNIDDTTIEQIDSLIKGEEKAAASEERVNFFLIKYGKDVIWLDENKKQCDPIKAEDGLTTSFTPGGKWNLVKKFKGPSHEEGGIDIVVGEGTIRVKEYDAKKGLVIKKGK